MDTMLENNRLQELKDKIIDIFKDILKVKTVNETDDFFSIGGDSYKSTLLLLKLHKEFNVDVPHGELFISSTVEKLAEYILNDGVESLQTIETVEEKEFYPISSAQKAIFILEQQFDNIGLTYNLPGIIEIHGKLEFTRLEKAFGQIIERHEILRTSFDLADGEPIQRIHQHVPFRLKYLEADESELDAIIQKFISPFDLKQAPLMRAELIKLDGNKSYLLFDMHHIISDGVSIGLFINELASLYSGKVLPPLNVQYKDYVAWQIGMQDTENVKKQEMYWESIFENGVPVVDMPADFARPTVKSFDGERLDFGIGEELSRKLKKFSAEEKFTLYMIFVAAYNVLISKYTGQEDIVIGTLTSGRGNSDTENMIGMFVNTLVLRNNPEESKTFMGFLREVKESVLKALENQDYQFQQLVSELGLNRDVSRNPLFDVGFVTQNMGNGGIEIPGLEFKPFRYLGRGSKFDLLFETSESENEIVLTVEYCTKLFKRDTIERMASHYKNILEYVINYPEATLEGINLLTTEEKNRLLYDFNATEIPYDSYKTVHQLFEEQAKKTPESTALVFHGEALSYRELDEKSNCLARFLRENGVKPNDIVGVMTCRSLEMIIGIMSILKAGGAYLPIDPEYPAERIAYMLEDSETNILLTNVSAGKEIEFKGKIIEIDLENLCVCDPHALESVNKSSDLAYVIYTSGSTGKPKGVMIEHRAVHNFIKGITDKIEFMPGQTILALTTVSFDIFVLETLLPLSKGLKIVIADEVQQRDPKQLNKLITENSVDMLQITPSRMQLLMSDNNCQSTLACIKVVMIGGEELPPLLLENLKGIYKGKIFNMYGPTESTVWSTVKEITDTQHITIGSPIANTQIYILDRNNNLQPIGVLGELCIAGDGLARGYLKRPEYTDEKFIPNPFKHGERIYKTGDLAKWLSEGEIEFAGRIDDQVKIRGYRIELGEIQTRLLAFDGVKEAVVVARADTNNGKYLCAYFVSEKEVNIAELRSFLAIDLPEYMIPSQFMRIEKIPLTPNGKVDRRSLPELDVQADIGKNYVVPETELQKSMAKVWERVLGKSNIGIDDDFFKIGGHSLLAIKLEVEMEKEEMPIDYMDLYKYRTIRDLAQYFINRR